MTDKQNNPGHLPPMLSSYEQASQIIPSPGHVSMIGPLGITLSPEECDQMVRVMEEAARNVVDFLPRIEGVVRGAIVCLPK